MKTKQISFVVALLFSAFLATGQEGGFGILAGVNLQNLNGEDPSGDRLENDLIFGFHGGVNYQIPLVPQFFIQPGLLFSTKGAKNESGGINTNYRLSYIELPVNFVYKGMLGNGYVMIGFGPYAAYGVGGKAKFEGGPVTVESDVKFQSVVEAGDPIDVVYFKPLDVGGNIFAGYEMGSGIFFQFNTQLGMINISPEDKRFPGVESKIKNTGFGLSLGYRL